MCQHVQTKASQDRISALRRRLSNQASSITPVPETPGAPHTAQQSGQYSAGNAESTPATQVQESQNETLPAASASQLHSQETAPTQLYRPESSQSQDDDCWPPVGRYSCNKSSILVPPRPANARFKPWSKGSASARATREGSCIPVP